MPLIQRNTITLSNLVYTTGNYVNPHWIVSLSPAKVGSGIAQWNASQIRGYPVYTGVPTSGQVLAWTSSGWYPSGITSGGGGGSSACCDALGFVTVNGTTSGILSTTGVTLIQSSPLSSGDCLKYITKAKYGTDLQSSEILLVANSSDSFMTQYGIVYTNSFLANFSCEISGSYINLFGQAVNANTEIKLFKITIN